MPHPSGRPAGLTATKLVAAYASRDLSPVEVLHDVADVIEAREPELNAFWHLDLEAAATAARASEERWRRAEPAGPIDGVPVTVKENLGRAGVPMPAGNAGVEPVVPTRSSPVVERVEESGGVVLGSTVMPDWGMLSSGVSSLHGITRSPVGPHPDDGRLELGRRCRGRGWLWAAPRRHRHRRLDPPARHVARPDDAQAQRGSRAPRHPLPRTRRRTTHPLGRRRGAPALRHQPT